MYPVYIHVHIDMSRVLSVVGSSPTGGNSFFLESDCLGCAVLLCLLLFDLACFFLSSHLSLKHVYTGKYNVQGKREPANRSIITWHNTDLISFLRSGLVTK